MPVMKKFLVPLLILGGAVVPIAESAAQSYVPEWKEKKMKVQPVVDIKAYAFNLGDVRLLESPFLDAMKVDAKWLLRLQPDKFLADFRVHAGLKPKGTKYGGWESSGLAGHSLGHYLSAISMQYGATKDTAFLNRVNYMVDELALCQESRKTGYIGAIPGEDSLWASVTRGDIRSRGFDLNGGWSPWYTVHKIFSGLLDAYLYCNNEKALRVAVGLADWTGNTIQHLDDAKMQQMMICEYGGMSEVLANTYALTGKKKYLDLSYRFYDKRVLDSLAAEKDALAGKHSNTQIPKIIASARRYELTKDQRDETIANFFWQAVTNDHSYATGGNSNYEYFGPARQLNDQLTENTTETCNTYNMLKLTMHLFAAEPSAHLMDYYEKGLYNHILSSQNHETAGVTYFVPLRMGGRKEYSTNSFTCCVGTGMENHVKYGESIYFRGKDGSLYVNLFIPSVLTWKEKGVTVKQEGLLPKADNVVFTIHTPKASSFTLRVRKPVWADGDLEVRVNGVLTKVVPGEDGYLAISRSWKNNDQVMVRFPLHLYTQAMPDNADRRAIFYGPILLAGVFGETEPDPVKGVPVLVTDQADPSRWLKQDVAAKVPTFESVSGVASPQTVTLVPFNTTKNEFYTVYWDVFTPEKWRVQQKVYEEERKKAQDLEAHTTDHIRLGEMQPERDHNFGGERTVAGEDHGKKWRLAEEEGYMTYTMKVSPDSKNTLMATYWGMDNRYRTFDVQVDGVTIATEDLNKYKASKFYEISYPVPDTLTKGKTSVVVKLLPKAHNNAGPLYESRMVKE